MHVWQYIYNIVAVQQNSKLCGQHNNKSDKRVECAAEVAGPRTNSSSQLQQKIVLSFFSPLILCVPLYLIVIYVAHACHTYTHGLGCNGLYIRREERRRKKKTTKQKSKSLRSPPNAYTAILLLGRRAFVRDLLPPGCCCCCCCWVVLLLGFGFTAASIPLRFSENVVLLLFFLPSFSFFFFLFLFNVLSDSCRVLAQTARYKLLYNVGCLMLFCTFIKIYISFLYFLTIFPI